MMTSFITNSEIWKIENFLDFIHITAMLVKTISPNSSTLITDNLFVYRDGEIKDSLTKKNYQSHSL